MEQIFDWSGRKWRPVRSRRLSRNPLFTLWRCALLDEGDRPEVPVVEYFNGAVYVPADLGRDFARDFCFADPQYPSFTREIHWIKMDSGSPANLISGIPL